MVAKHEPCGVLAWHSRTAKPGFIAVLGPAWQEMSEMTKEWKCASHAACFARTKARNDAQVAACLGLEEGQQAVDLHGLSGLEARAAVLCVLSSVQQRAALGQPLAPGLTFITGAWDTPALAMVTLRNFYHAWLSNIILNLHL